MFGKQRAQPPGALGRRSARRHTPHPPKRIDAKLAVQIALLVLAVLYTLYFASGLFIPLVAAVLLYQLLHGPVQKLHEFGLPLSLGAAIVIFVLLGIVAGGAHLLAEPAEQWLQGAPASLGELRRELQQTAGTLDELRELGEEIDELATMGEDDSGIMMVQIQPPGHLRAITGSLPAVITGALLAFVTCFFLLVQGDNLQRGLVVLGPTRQSRRRISNVLRGVQMQISTYLRTVTIINVCLGIVVGFVMFGLGVPHPALWGALAGLLNFAPYIGPAVNAFILLVVGVITFDTLGEAVSVPAAYLVITSLEGMVLTPMILGRTVNIGSLWVFLSVVFWGWMWGGIGALMAVPLTATIIIVWVSLRDEDPFRSKATSAGSELLQ